MIKVIASILSFFLIGIIFLRIPEENVGLGGFATKNNLLGSPKNTTRFLNIITGVSVLGFFSLAIQLNSLNQ